uniref:THAP-type domain-containing protein n=1 Tax=Periophthalmus magnuspinnatus TaxID=409849 RepID=A0A3B4AFY1_9GOBI
MVSYCCVKNCRNHKKTSPRNPEVTYHGIPVWLKAHASLSELTLRRRMAWVAMPSSAKVCSLHFHRGKPAHAINVSNPDWAPSLNLDYSVTPLASPNRVLQPQRVQIIQPLEVKKKKNRNCCYRGDNEKVRYHTGLPDFDTFEALMNTVAPHLSQNVKCMSPYQMFLLTFMHLKLNLPLKYLIYLFQTTRRMALVAVTDTISTLNAQFGHIVQWPCLEAIKSDLPGFFESSDDHVAVMVDIFDISTLHGTTVKYMISASPWGNIKFISKGFTNNVSDEDIEQTGILETLLPGDLVLADCSFQLEKNEGWRCVKALPKYPGMVKMITNHRLAVKKAALNIQRFTFLTGQVSPVMLLQSEGEETTLLDKIVKVCCAITNIWPPKPSEKKSTE